jgi:polar amino acid transport system substrate-binding protein
MHLSSCLLHSWRCMLVAVFSLWCSSAVAGPVSCGDKPIRMAFYEFGTFYFLDKKIAQGIDKDVVEELAKRSGCKFETQVMARARIWANLADGTLDMSVSGIQNPERDRFAWFAHYMSIKNYVVLRAAVAQNTSTAEGFLKQPKLQFGAVRAFKHGAEQDKWLTELRGSERVQDSATVDVLFKKLKEGRIDALYSQPAVYGKYLVELDMAKDAVVQDWTPGEKGVPHGLILAKARFTESDAKAWQTLVSSLRTDGTLKRIYSRYVSAADATAMLDF